MITFREKRTEMYENDQKIVHRNVQERYGVNVERLFTPVNNCFTEKNVRLKKRSEPIGLIEKGLKNVS